MPAEAERVLAEVGLPAEPGLVARVGDYLNRTRRGRRRGLIAGFALCVVTSALFSFPPGPFKWTYPMLLVGYALGVLITELRAPAPARGTRRAADLTVRTSASLVPRGARAAMWASALPVLIAVSAMPPAAAMVRSVGRCRSTRGCTSTCTRGQP